MKKYFLFSAVSSLFIMAGLVFSLGFTSSKVGAQGKPIVEFVDVNKPQSETHPHFTITSNKNIFTDRATTSSSFGDSPIVLPGDQPVTQAYCTVDCGGGRALTCGCPGCAAGCSEGGLFDIPPDHCSVFDDDVHYRYEC